MVAEISPREVILMFDGDNAGYAITDRIAKMLSTNFAESAVVPCYLPMGRDPKTLDGAELNAVVDEARKLHQVKIRSNLGFG